MEKSIFFRRRVCILAGSKRIFLKDLKLPINSFFWARSGNIKSVKKNKEKYGKIKIFFFLPRVSISVGCKHVFLKDLKLPINPYFCRTEKVIKKKLEKYNVN